MIDLNQYAPVVLNEVKAIDSHVYDLAVANVTNQVLAAELTAARRALEDAAGTEDAATIDASSPASTVPSEERPDTPKES